MLRFLLVYFQNIKTHKDVISQQRQDFFCSMSVKEMAKLLATVSCFFLVFFIDLFFDILHDVQLKNTHQS
ncbi:hypothetical protein BGP_4192 [Beggiatoa sp. PS]|nr:hypothetical protein BGP_4192 [Beggiatoa sp. PS]